MEKKKNPLLPWLALLLFLRFFFLCFRLPKLKKLHLSKGNTLSLSLPPLYFLFPCSVFGAPCLRSDFFPFNFTGKLFCSQSLKRCNSARAGPVTIEILASFDDGIFRRYVLFCFFSHLYSDNSRPTVLPVVRLQIDLRSIGAGAISRKIGFGGARLGGHAGENANCRWCFCGWQ